MPLCRLARGFQAALPCGFAALLALACSEDPDGSTVEGGDANGKGNGTAAAGPHLTGLGTGGTSGVGSSGATVPVAKNDACVTNSQTADAIPAVLQLVVDTSGSMDWPPGWMPEDQNDQPPPGETKWEITRVALKEAVAKLPATVALGLNFYPNDPGRNSCIRNRIEVPIALLGAAASAQRTDFDDAIDAASPDGGTPTHAAYRFGAETARASDLEGRKFVLLITDGIPTYTLECEGGGLEAVDSQPLIDEATQVFEDGISTFVIGSPGSEAARADLSRIASEGGTAAAGCSDMGPAFCHLDMTQAPDFGAALAAGLGQIAGRISACEYAVPQAPSGQSIDPGRVNVVYTKADASEHSIPRDPSAMECNSGWQYTADMSKIMLCGADCDAVKADPTAKIELLFGCVTSTGEPPK